MDGFSIDIEMMVSPWDGSIVWEFPGECASTQIEANLSGGFHQFRIKCLKFEKEKHCANIHWKSKWMWFLDNSQVALMMAHNFVVSISHCWRSPKPPDTVDLLDSRDSFVANKLSNDAVWLLILPLYRLSFILATWPAFASELIGRITGHHPQTHSGGGISPSP